MATNQQPTDIKRRKPRQTRAVDTVETIFEATARIIERQGVGAVNTNYIAERAGIAIGTLYGYFPNKQAILLAMARRELGRIQDAICTAIESADSGSEIVPMVVRLLIHGFGGRNQLRRVLLEAVVAQGQYVELARPVENVAQLILSRGGKHQTFGQASMTEAQVFVLTRALVGTIRAAAFEDSPFMGTEALEQELVRLTESYISSLG
jgi:AcrR family transcriptional regulator